MAMINKDREVPKEPTTMSKSHSFHFRHQLGVDAVSEVAAALSGLTEVDDFQGTFFTEV